MMENNTFRIIMGIAAIVLVGSLITILVGNQEEIKNVIDVLFLRRIQKY